jgi:hypothetical protein
MVAMPVKKQQQRLAIVSFRVNGSAFGSQMLQELQNPFVCYVLRFAVTHVSSLHSTESYATSEPMNTAFDEIVESGEII